MPNKVTQKKQLEKRAKYLLICGLGIILLAAIFIAFLPLIITQYTWFPLDVYKPNEIGDTLGGIMGPAVALVGVLVTFLAFWAQYVANLQQKQQFLDSLEIQEQDKKEQQFESQFFEMLRLHKENVDELKINSLSDNSVVEKRMVFETMVKEFNELLSRVDDFDSLNQENFDISYNLFFWGYDNTDISLLSQVAIDWLYAKGLSANHKLINFSKHKGYSALLGHYFRHLYLMVKFVAESKVIKDYDVKMKYLKILRAQLSNHEQIMLFYNWLATSYGDAWEEETENGNKFFTSYKMIHNLWNEELYQSQFIVNWVNKLIEIYNCNPKTSPLFEFQRNNFNLKMRDIPTTL
jgi:hypothetical protein